MKFLKVQTFSYILLKSFGNWQRVHARDDDNTAKSRPIDASAVSLRRIATRVLISANTGEKVKIGQRFPADGETRKNWKSSPINFSLRFDPFNVVRL